MDEVSEYMSCSYPNKQQIGSLDWNPGIFDATWYIWNIIYMVLHLQICVSMCCAYKLYYLYIYDIQTFKLHFPFPPLFLHFLTFPTSALCSLWLLSNPFVVHGMRLGGQYQTGPNVGKDADAGHLGLCLTLLFASCLSSARPSDSLRLCLLVLCAGWCHWELAAYVSCES